MSRYTGADKDRITPPPPSSSYNPSRGNFSTADGKELPPTPYAAGARRPSNPEGIGSGAYASSRPAAGFGAGASRYASLSRSGSGGGAVSSGAGGSVGGVSKPYTTAAARYYSSSKAAAGGGGGGDGGTAGVGSSSLTGRNYSSTTNVAGGGGSALGNGASGGYSASADAINSSSYSTPAANSSNYSSSNNNNSTFNYSSSNNNISSNANNYGSSTSTYSSSNNNIKSNPSYSSSNVNNNNNNNNNNNRTNDYSALATTNYSSPAFADLSSAYEIASASVPSAPPPSRDVDKDPYGAVVENLKASEVLPYFFDRANSPVDKRRALIRLSAVADEGEAKEILEKQFLQLNFSWYLDTLSHSIRKLFVMCYLRSDADVEARLKILDGMRDILLREDDSVFGSMEVIDGLSFVITQSLKSEAFKSYFGRRPNLIESLVIDPWRDLSPRFSLKKPITHLCRSLHRETVQNVESSLQDDPLPHIRAKEFPQPSRMNEVLDFGRSPQYRRAALALFLSGGGGEADPAGKLSMTSSPSHSPSRNASLDSGGSGGGRSNSRDRPGLLGGRSKSQGTVGGTPVYHQTLQEFKTVAIRIVQDPDFLHVSDLFFNAILATDPTILVAVAAESASSSSRSTKPGMRNPQTSPNSSGGGSSSVAAWASDLLSQLSSRVASHSPLLRESRAASALQRLFDILHAADPTRAALIQASQAWVNRFPRLPVQVQEVLVGIFTLRHPTHAKLPQMVVDYHLALSYAVEAWTAVHVKEEEERWAKEERQRKALRRQSSGGRGSSSGGRGGVLGGRKKWNWGLAFGLGPVKEVREEESGKGRPSDEQVTVDMHLAMSYIIEAETRKMEESLRPEQEVVDEHYALSYEIEHLTRAAEKAREDARRLEQVTADHHLALSHLIEIETRKALCHVLTQEVVDEHLALSYLIEEETRKMEKAKEDEIRLQQVTIDHHLALSYLIEIETRIMEGDPTGGAASRQKASQATESASSNNSPSKRESDLERRIAQLLAENQQSASIATQERQKRETIERNTRKAIQQISLDRHIDISPFFVDTIGGGKPVKHLEPFDASPVHPARQYDLSAPATQSKERPDMGIKDLERKNGELSNRVERLETLLNGLFGVLGVTVNQVSGYPT
ncbi:hypothetical protein HDU67_004390 [Dinochytrium kinnereticum]|nr:hypothetical protein HDU67_004390 [Dinochytrium kinnereticum]